MYFVGAEDARAFSNTLETAVTGAHYSTIDHCPLCGEHIYRQSHLSQLREARRKILCKRFSTKSRMALENRADSGLDPLITESHGGQNGMCAGTA